MAEALRRRVTVVEDSAEVADLLVDVLASDGLEVSVLDGQTTIRQIEISTPDLLVIDWRLSGGPTGLHIIRQARAKPNLRTIPIIVWFRGA